MEEIPKLTKEEAILAAIPWRCFHCDFVTSDREEARAHFGDCDDAEEFTPSCKWWSNMDDQERKEQFQSLLAELNGEREATIEQIDRARDAERQIETLECRIAALTTDFQSFKPFAKCTSANDAFFVYDSMEGRALASEERLKEAGLWNES